MDKVSVDLNEPTFYSEPETKFHRFKRKLTLQPVLRRIRKIFPKTKFSHYLILEQDLGFYYLSLNLIIQKLPFLD